MSKLKIYKKSWIKSEITIVNGHTRSDSRKYKFQCFCRWTHDVSVLFHTYEYDGRLQYWVSSFSKRLQQVKKTALRAYKWRYPLMGYPIPWYRFWKPK